MMNESILKDCAVRVTLPRVSVVELDLDGGDEVTIKTDDGEITGEVVATAQNTRTEMAEFGLDVIKNE